MDRPELAVHLIILQAVVQSMQAIYIGNLRIVVHPCERVMAHDPKRDIWRNILKDFREIGSDVFENGGNPWL